MGWSSLWTTALLLPALILSPTADSLTIDPRCQASCGGVDVPYPFGIGADCFRPGFEIACVNRTTPVLAAATDPAIQVLSLSVTPRPEARVMLPVAYECYNKTGHSTDYSYGAVDINTAGVYRISNVYNDLFVLGCNTFGFTNSGPSGRSRYMFYTGCAAYCNDSGSAQDGACAGVGCCRIDIPPGLTDNFIKFSSWSHVDMEFSPCDYAFLVEKGNYTFRAADLHMDGKQTSMPVRLDWAIRDSSGSSMSMSCAQAANKPGYGCKSNHSECVDSTNGPGYFCNCSKGYEGNPYLTNGCTNINECEHSREEYPCHGECHDTEGSYDCRCHLGYESNGDPKENPCNPKFPLAAKITLATVLVTSVVVIALLSVVITIQKRQIFRNNGGNILKNVASLLFFTEREVKKITSNYREFLGKGAFGEVYVGNLLDKDGTLTKVAVKRSSAAVTKPDEFAKEVEIQSKMIHKNVLRLKGCCLEVKCPMLVYEYAANGNLRDIIHGKDEMKQPFPLERRLDIAIGSAEGLAYMHWYTEFIIQHGDVKPDNILLDEKFVPKLADFGLSRLVASGKQYLNIDIVIGCLGYMDPAFPDTKKATSENDVYSFGVVLLELVARKPIEPSADAKKECRLVTEFRRVYEKENKDNTTEEGNNQVHKHENDRHKMLDKDIATKENIPVLEGIVRLAIECLGGNRPDMTEVVTRLKVLKYEWMKHGKTSSQVTEHPDEAVAADTPNRISFASSAGKTESDNVPLLKS